MQNHMSSRRREALRLDLEDQQKALIEEVYRLTRGLINGISVPKSFRDRLLEETAPVCAWTPEQAHQLDERVGRLRQVTRALGRVDRPEFGICDLCGEPIRFALLAEDATRGDCGGRCIQAVSEEG